MANFNVGLNPTNDPGYGAGGPTRISTPNSAGEAARANSERLVRSIGDFIGGIADAGDDLVQNKIEEELQGGFDKVIDSQGGNLFKEEADKAPVYGESVAPASSNTGGVDSPPVGAPPPAIQKNTFNSAQRLVEAYNQGKISETTYLGQMQSLVSRVKSNYPGYSDIIDKRMEKITGQPFANSLRKATLSLLEKQENDRKSKMDSQEKFILNNAEYMSQQDREDFRGGKLSTEAAIGKIQDYKGQVQELQAKISRINADSAQGRLDEDTAKRSASDLVFGAHNLALGNIQTLANEAKKDIDAGTFDPVAYGQKLQLLRMDFKEKSLQMLQASGLTKKLDVNQTNQILAEEDKQFDEYSKIFTDKDTGNLSLLKNKLEFLNNQIAMGKSQDIKKLTDDSRTGVPLRALTAAQTVGGPQVASTLLDQFNKKMDIGTTIGDVLKGTPIKVEEKTANDPVVKGLIFNFRTYLGLGDREKGNPILLMENLHKIGKLNNTSVIQTLANWRDNLTNPAFGDTFNKNSADVLFSGENKDMLQRVFKDATGRRVAYNILTSPEVTKRLKAMGGPAYDNYKKWAYHNFITVFKGSANKLQSISDRPYLDLKVNEQNGHLELVPTPEGEKEAARHWYDKSLALNATEGIETLLQKGIREDVNGLNKAIDNINPILEGDKYSSSEQVKNVIISLYKAQPEKRGLWGWMMKSIKDTELRHEDLTFGGRHPNFTQASGDSSGGLVSMVEEYGATHTGNHIMEMIAHGESNSNYNRLVDTVTHPKEIPLTNMTIGEVLAYQKGMNRAGNASSAAGKYQIVGTTLRGLVEKGVVSLEDKYNEATQDKLANTLLEGRGYKDFLEGKKPLKDFMKDLGKEWEIIKVNPSLARKVAEELMKQRDARNNEEESKKEEPKGTKALAYTEYEKEAQRKREEFAKDPQAAIEKAIREKPKKEAAGPSMSEALSKEEKNLYNHHLDNLKGSGKVINEDKSISTVKATIVTFDDRSYIIPTVYDGKHHTTKEAVERAKEKGLDKYPSYKSVDEALKREKELHSIMEKDTDDYIKKEVK